MVHWGSFFLCFLLLGFFLIHRKTQKTSVCSCHRVHEILGAEACLCMSVFSFSKQRLHGAELSRSNLWVSGSWTLGKLQAAASQQEKGAPGRSVQEPSALHMCRTVKRNRRRRKKKRNIRPVAARVCDILTFFPYNPALILLRKSLKRLHHSSRSALCFCPFTVFLCGYSWLSDF